MRLISQLAKNGLGLTLLLSQVACVNTTPPAQFYLLEASKQPPVILADKPKPLLVLAPVRIAPYLDRAQIVTATGENSYQMSEFNRWAEGLDHNITRVLQQDLTNAVPADVLAAATTTALKLSVNVLALHVDAQGQAILTVQWQLSRDNQVLVNRQQSYQQLASVSDYPVMVRALNACLRQLTQDMVESVRTVSARY